MKTRAKITAAKAEKKQQNLDAGFLSALFPNVTEISISMMYQQTGVLEPLSRTVNFLPGSYAMFKLNCLCSECIEGWFDFTKIINAMVKTRKTVAKGEISCESCSVPECSDVAYTVTIKYAKMK